MTMPKSSSALKTNIRRAASIVVVILIVAAVAWLKGVIADAREQARRRPSVSGFGMGGPGFESHEIYASGEPPEDVAREIRRYLQNMVDRDELRRSRVSAFDEERLSSVIVQIHTPVLLGDALEPLVDARAEVTHLNLENVILTPSCFGRFAQMKSLMWLNMRNSRISDETLPTLEQCSNLNSLDLRDNDLSDGAVAELRTAIPDCSIRR